MVTYSELKYSDYFKTELPIHWQEKRLGFLAMQTKNAFVDGPFGSDLKSDDYLDEGVPLIQLNNIRDGKHILRNMKFISDNKRIDLIRHLALPQDIVIAKMAEPVARAAVVSDEYDEYVIVADCVKLTPDLELVDLNFLIWAINSDCVRENAELVSTGTTRIRINLGELKKLKVPYPSLSEQIKIRQYLDHETAKIDTLIAKQEKLIELLKEKRQAVISHAVTKGLNPKVPMKDSGNIWAEKIPNHWKLTKLTYVARVGNGATPSRDNEAYWKDGSIGWLNSSKVNDVIITEADQFITPLAKTQTSVQIVQPNDLVMAITGEGQTRGRVAICQLDATINQHLASIRITDKNLNHEFLFCWLTANYERIRYESTGAGSTKGAITCGDIGLYPVPLPPYAEQLEIVANIKKQSDTFKRLIVKAESAIQLMQERRTALISSAVTGKIDVRNWQDPNEAKTELSA